MALDIRSSCASWLLDTPVFQATDTVTLVAGVGSLTAKDGNNIPSRGISQGFNGKVFAKYRVPSGFLRNAFIGAGYVYTGQVPGTAVTPTSLANLFYLPSYSLVDGLAGYDGGRWRIQVNVDNVLNRTYAAGSVSNAFIYAGLPRNYTASFTYKF